MAARPKQDFAGKKKKKSTYDDDWVFKKNSGPTPGGLWLTKDQAKDQHNDQMAAKRERAAASAPPIPTTRNASAPGVYTQPGAAIPGVPIPLSAQGAPDWWIGQAYQNPNANQAFANAANALMPTFSPEDQRNMGTYLATNFKDIYGGYANANFAPIPTEITGERQQYINPERVQSALTLLDRMREASGAGEDAMGKGYDFLKNALNLMNKYSSTGPMTREQYDQFTAGISALTSQAGTDIRAYSNLAQMFNLPSFTAGPIVSNTPNTNLYT
jgi:hypothetical protein